ncbi:MAG: universal stress protein [Nocardioides sp.]
MSLAITRQAACPVVVVRPHHPGVVRQGVLVGADGSADSSPTLEFAFRQASVRRLPLTALHVVEHAVDDPEDHALLVGEAMAGLRERYPDVPVQVTVGHGHPDNALLAAADRMHLLVVGSHHGGLTHRSITSAVVEQARCPVAVVPLGTAAAASHT